MRRFRFAYLVVLVAFLTRFVPHLPNLSPVLASLLFGGAHLKRRDAIWYPLALLAASGFVLTTVVYRMRIGPDQSIIWLGFAVVALIGYWLRKRENVAGITVAALAGPTAFFVIGNFGVLVMSEGTFGERSTSYYDFYRIQDGKMEPIPPRADWKNANGKF